MVSAAQVETNPQDSPGVVSRMWIANVERIDILLKAPRRDSARASTKLTGTCVDLGNTVEKSSIRSSTVRSWSPN